ncbi:ATP-dependent endonuclease [Promethearchaeum syntrophicum]|uniref:ATP-dependent endonuclease n=1 Tax=Promethearchaeum syntrophicum TaxID=2594042 RepID=A0A5B9DDJ0_9ARCH|nr:AAA family ATPase [Candidatus Prometheoarchaeum syntrophicum]QEE16840.1 chromosome segregation protein [Candidatus Prometheoarchaeum syntrophicum]
MKIKHIKIQGYRSLDNFSINLSDYTVIVGKNNAGKSNLLSAINSFYHPKLLTINDATRNGLGDIIRSEISIKLTFDKLLDSEKQNNQKYVENNQIIVELVAKVRDEEDKIVEKLKPEHHGYIKKYDYEFSDSIESKIRELVCSETVPSQDVVRDVPILNIIAQVEAPSGRITKERWNNILTKFIDQVPGIRKIPKIVRDDDHKYQGFIGSNSAENSGRCLFIPAILNPSENLDETKQNSQIYRLVSSLMNKSIPQPLEDEFSNFVEKLNNERDSTRQDLIDRFDEELRVWDTKIDITLDKPSLENALPVAFKINFNDGVPTDLRHKGTGLQRYIFFKFLKIYNELMQDSEISLILLFEEPEAHLHPHFQREIAEIIEGLKSSLIHHYQIILTTHSPQFIDVTRMENLYRFSRLDNHCTDSENCFLDLSNINDKLKTAYFFNPHVREVFFADKVILVEGISEIQFFEYLKNQGVISFSNCSIIGMGGKQNYRYFIPILNAAKIPYCIVVDEDPYFEPHYKIKNENSLRLKRRDYLITKDILNKIDSNLGKLCVISPDFDTLIGTSKNQLSSRGKHIATNYRLKKIYTSALPDFSSKKNELETIAKKILNFETISDQSIQFPGENLWTPVDQNAVSLTEINEKYIVTKLIGAIKNWKNSIKTFTPIQAKNFLIELRKQTQTHLADLSKKFRKPLDAVSEKHKSTQTKLGNFIRKKDI